MNLPAVFKKLLSFLGEAHKNLAFSISLEPSCDDFEGLLRSLFLRRWRCSFSWRISVKQTNISSNGTPSCSFLLGTGRSLQNHHFYQPNSWILYEKLHQISPLPRRTCGKVGGHQQAVPIHCQVSSLTGKKIKVYRKHCAPSWDVFWTKTLQNPCDILRFLDL